MDKYTVAEIERRWLVERDALGPLEGLPWRDIEDLYIANSRLRLRKLTGMDGASTYKLCKKYGKSGALSEPITNLYLSEAEFTLLAALPGQRLRKRRHGVAGGSVDIYAGDAPLVVFEVEFTSEAEAQRYHPPAFAGREVTQDPAFSGAALAGPTA